mgnify:CR=1 FL=1
MKGSIIEVIASEGMVDRSKVTPDATIESLDLKSVDIVMILTALEEKFNVYIPMDGSLQEAKTVEGQSVKIGASPAGVRRPGSQPTGDGRCSSRRCRPAGRIG